MINLDVKGYCEECPYFEPVCEKIKYAAGSRSKHDTDITCKNKDVCEYAISHCFGGGSNE